MTTIVVIRGAGDVKGPDVVDPLLAELTAQLARGAAEMDAHSGVWQTVSLSVVPRAGLHRGQLVEVHDAAQGASWRGKITGIRLATRRGETTADLDIMRLQEDF